MQMGYVHVIYSICHCDKAMILQISPLCEEMETRKVYAIHQVSIEEKELACFGFPWQISHKMWMDVTKQWINKPLLLKITIL